MIKGCFFFTPGPYTLLVSYCCSNKLPQTLCLNTTHIYYITVLEVRNMNWIYLGKIKVSARLCFFPVAPGESVF